MPSPAACTASTDSNARLATKPSGRSGLLGHFLSVCKLVLPLVLTSLVLINEFSAATTTPLRSSRGRSRSNSRRFSSRRRGSGGGSRRRCRSGAAESRQQQTQTNMFTTLCCAAVGDASVTGIRKLTVLS